MEAKVSMPGAGSGEGKGKDLCAPVRESAFRFGSNLQHSCGHLTSMTSVAYTEDSRFLI